MAPPKLEAEHLRMIPEFSGEAALLPEFISISQQICDYFTDTVNPENFQNFYLLNTLKSKITGVAKLNISSYNINTWDDLKNALLTTYEDKRDAYTLTIELCNLRQYGNESAFDFHQRVQKHINLHTSYLNTHTEEIAGATHVATYISKLALRTFLKGLKDPLGSFVKTRNPKDMNEALNLLTNDFQMDAKRTTHENTSHNPNNTLNSRPKSVLPHIPFRPQIPFRNQTYQRPAFPTNPHQYQRSPNPHAQSSVYNPNSNQYQKPVFNNFGQNRFQNSNQRPPFFPKPIPMSGIQTIRDSNFHQIDLQDQYDQYQEPTTPQTSISSMESQIYDPIIDQNAYAAYNKENYNNAEPPHIQDFPEEASDVENQ